MSVSFEKTAASSSILVPIRQVEEKLIEILVAGWGGIRFDNCLVDAQSLRLHIGGCMLQCSYVQCLGCEVKDLYFLVFFIIINYATRQLFKPLIFD